MTRALLYLRQSSTDGEGERSLSLDSQAAILRADAERYAWTVAGEIRDADEKGHDDRRPGLRELYDRCRGGDVDVVAVWSLSRLARSVRITEAVVHELDTLGVQLHSHEESWAGQPLFRQIVAAVAEQQTRDIKAHVRRALREKANRGQSHGRVAFGYDRDPQTGILTPNGHAETVRQMFALRAAGAGYREIAAALERSGTPPPQGAPVWRWQSIAYVLRNPTYLGGVAYAGGAHPEAHPPLIDGETWQRAQRHPAGRDRAPRAPAGSWLNGLVLHGCGQPMYYTAGDRRRFRCRTDNWETAPCPIRPHSITAHRLEAPAWEAIVRDLGRVRRLSIGRIVRDAEREFARAAPASLGARREAEQRRERAAASRERAIDLYLAGRIDRARFDAEDARAGAEIAEADRQIAHLPAPPDPAGITHAWGQLATLAEGLRALTEPAARAAVLRELGVIVVDGADIRVRYRPEYAAIVGR